MLYCHLNKITTFSDPLYIYLQEWITFNAKYHNYIELVELFVVCALL